MPELKRFDPDTATHEDFVALNKYDNIITAEAMPDDPPMSLETTIKNAKAWNVSEKHQNHVWHLWEDSKIIAGVWAGVGFYDTNRHLFNGNLGVLPDYRRKGLATQLLTKLLEVADTHQRTLLVFETGSNVPASQMFAEQLGATKGSEGHLNQLVLAEVDKTLLESWLDVSKNKAKDFELGFWGNVFPEENLDEIARLIEVMNDAPRGDLQVEDFRVKPEDLRDWEVQLKARNTERRTLYVRHKSGELAGYTETFWDTENPENLWQGATGVIPKYRGHSLGKWLKAAMIQKIQADRPSVKRVRTGNADANAPMLAINQALGFRPYIAYMVWQIEVEKLKFYLQSKSP